MKKLLDVQVIDDIIPTDQRQQLWNYIENQTWHITYKPLRFDGLHRDFIPSKDKDWRALDPVRLLPNMFMPRACFGSDESSLSQNHPLIYDLWLQINSALGNEFSIAGSPEGMPMDSLNDPKWIAPDPIDPDLEKGWRVYANSQPSESIKRSHGIHRDTIDLEDDKCYTLLYVANLEWYPSWFAECIFYPNDLEGSVGDHQQHQSILASNQSRNFSIGWADEGRIVSPKPGRIILYDGRTLHTTRPSAIWAKSPRKVIAFRIRKK